MNLQKGQLFHSRYLLVKQLGNGASAEVWAAKDTKANNLVVALKVFSPGSNMDSYGLQNFEKEFTTVFNLKHSNLLPPSNYDIFQGRPYLVMQYCENGSCSSMVGRANEDDIIKFLHDVAAGLEYLHDHNIIHQDIKPDNILLDDNCNFMVTDFGISIAYDSQADTSDMSGGTRAYMGPERFNGTTNTASDIWSLGATAVELLTGNPPYGDHGGLLQAEGEALPELPATLQPEVKSMILACLEEDPAKRIKANEIRQKIELYWETGAWERRSNKKLIAIVVTSAVSVLMCLGIFFWDYNRTKVYYYKDYAEYWGVPKGIGRLSGSEMQHRDQSYRIESRQWKVRRMALVNSAGKVIGHTDTEHMNSRFSDVYYFYTADGQIDYKTICDTNGRLMFKMDYDENLKTATFRLNDEYGTEMNLDASITKLYKGGANIFDEKSKISRYLLTYNDEGLLVERRFAGFQNTLVRDAEGIHGQHYLYDDKGRVVEEQFLGINGDVTGNQIGLAIKVTEYDDDDNWITTTYLNAERKPSHDGNNCSVVRLDYDEYGNRTRETYFTANGEPSLRTDLAVFGFSYTYDERGNRLTQSCLGMDGELAYCNAGFVTMENKYDENGFSTETRYCDEHGNTVRYTSEGESYGIYRSVPNEHGLWLEVTMYDEFDNELENSAGYSKLTRAYDDEGKLTEERYFKKDGSQALWGGFYCQQNYTYDEFDRLTEINHYDAQGSLTADENGVATYRLEYNRQGAITKMAYYDAKGNPILNSNRIAGFTFEYDELGNQKSAQYFGVNGKPCMSGEGYSSVEYTYDEKTNFLVSTKYFNANKQLIKEQLSQWDDRGNIVKQYTVNSKGQLVDKSAVNWYEYDVNNRCVREWTTNLSGKKINRPDASYCEVRYKYDDQGNCTEGTFWSVNGNPTLDGQKTHKRILEYDQMNRVVYEKNLDASGKPVKGAGVNPEGRRSYDQFGNLAEILCYDGAGNPCLSADGFHRQIREYNKRNDIERVTYYGVDGQLVMSKSDGFAVLTKTYDDKGNVVEEAYYNAKNECFKLEKNKYNNKNNIVEWLIFNGKNKPTDEFYSFSRLVIEYDETGVVPVSRKCYNSQGRLLGTQRYNAQKADWGEWQFNGQPQAVSNTANWREEIEKAARDCPVEVEDGVVVQSIYLSGNTVYVVFKLTEYSKYNMDDSVVDKFKKVGREQFEPYMREAIGLPSNMSLIIIINDKADREICRV